ncbi:MAG: hypothetical protein IKF14_03300 [Atopobiaceae bacterium]|nr:hypothetical protein [Atopobiaceae bacterium]
MSNTRNEVTTMGEQYDQEMRDYVSDLLGTGRHAIVRDVAFRTGVPAEIVNLLSGEDAETLTEQARALAQEMGDPRATGAPSIPEAGMFPRDERADDEQHEYIRALFNRP